ncbi:MAG: hypothetical protein AABY15_03950 [Nanoarchaeota archaeon]
MKQKISVTIDEKTRKLVQKEIAEGLFRNLSHAVEFSLNKIIKEKHLNMALLKERKNE